MSTSDAADIRFYFDPVCPFAWMTSKWVRMVMDQRDYRVDWRFISLRQVNAEVDYDAWFPPEYEAGHNAGLHLLRVAARTRAEHGSEAVGELYAALGTQVFDTATPDQPGVSQDLDPATDGVDHRGTREFLEPALERAGLPLGLGEALTDDDHDPTIRAETDEALALTGKDVGTPIIHFEPASESGGVAFFGPVISRLPEDADALALWDHVVGLARFPGFSELKRSLRELPQLRGLGVEEGEVGKAEDWHGGSRRQHK